jgi:hypothetical protein
MQQSVQQHSREEQVVSAMSSTAAGDCMRCSAVPYAENAPVNCRAKGARGAQHA